MAIKAKDNFGWCPVIFCIFLVLKLTNHIDWSWWWVTAPLWFPFALVIPIAFVAMILAAFK